ncbi:hypothetical protein BFP76_05160 [Amylibacter kogurei]|uniref:AB hydrolase-1 domain-containing protein n=1 Tax=Paramylibacter kogurei TaxID=1889778 RepID=A0A2G5K6S5_9RHOB|nr:alpha/beta hydrolase [Amylibacter kogurei]PIB24580.1 hypothetical protein BFP76_05160 [Amylibacter kogurei]
MLVKIGIICLFAAIAITLIVWISAVRSVQIAEKNHPPIGDFLNIAGKRVHYVKMGPPIGRAPVIILLHGAGGNLRDWTFKVAPELSKNYTVIAFDRPGHGYTDVYDIKGESPQYQADILRQATQKLGIKNAVVVGYSLGGAVAIAWALDYPQMLDGILLLSSVSNPWIIPPSDLYDYVGHPLTSYIVAPIISAFVPTRKIRNDYARVFTPQSPPDGFLDHVGTALTVRPKSFRANARQVRGLLRNIKLMSQRYDELSLPIEIIHGTRDRSVPAAIHAKVMKQRVPHANLTLIPSMGHGAHQLATPEIYSAIARLTRP